MDAEDMTRNYQSSCVLYVSRNKVDWKSLHLYISSKFTWEWFVLDHSRIKVCLYWLGRIPDSKFHGPTWGPPGSAPDGPRVVPMNLAIRDLLDCCPYHKKYNANHNCCTRTQFDPVSSNNVVSLQVDTSVQSPHFMASRFCLITIAHCLHIIQLVHLRLGQNLGQATVNIIMTQFPSMCVSEVDVYSISQEICTRFCCALLCCGYAIVHNEFTWSIYPYSSGLLCWHWGNR